MYAAHASAPSSGTLQSHVKPRYVSAKPARQRVAATPLPDADCKQRTSLVQRRAGHCTQPAPSLRNTPGCQVPGPGEASVLAVAATREARYGMRADSVNEFLYRRCLQILHVQYAAASHRGRERGHTQGKAVSPSLMRVDGPVRGPCCGYESTTGTQASLR